MSPTRSLAGLLALTLVSAALAVAPPPRPLAPAELQRLVDQLGHRDYRLREQAERRLHAEGQPALPALRQALAHKDPEVRRRALRLIPGLEHAALVSPRRVSLVVERQPMRVVLERIAKASGYKVMAYNLGAAPAGGEPTYSYNFQNATFWEVMDRVCRDGKLMVQPSWGDETVRLSSVPSPPPHVGRDGAFRYVASQFQMHRSVDLTTGGDGGAAARSDSLTLQFNLYAEPRLPFLGMGEIRVEAAYDNERNSMLLRPAPTDGPLATRGIVRYHGGGYKQFYMQAGVGLQRVSERATQLRELRGVVPVTLLVEQRLMTVSDDVLKAKGTKKTIGDLEFHIENVQKMANDQYQVKFAITNKGNANDYSWQNTLYQRLELFDEKGVKFQNWGSSWSSGGPGGRVSLTLTYNGNFGAAKPGAPKRFVYQHWITRQHDVHFHFKDIPLP